MPSYANVERTAAAAEPYANTRTNFVPAGAVAETLAWT